MNFVQAKIGWELRRGRGEGLSEQLVGQCAIVTIRHNTLLQQRVDVLWQIAKVDRLALAERLSHDLRSLSWMVT